MSDTPERGERERQEEELWQKLLEKFDDEQRHKDYLRFCVEHNLIGTAIKRYDEYSNDKERYPVELRRIARIKHQQLLGVMMVDTRIKAPSSSSKLFGTIGLIDILSVVLVLVLFFGSLFLESWIVGILSLVALGGYMAYKFHQAKSKLERTGGGDRWPGTY